MEVTDDGLVFLADGMGFLRCFDAETGEQYWEHDLEDDVTCRSQFVVDGKVYVGNDKRHYFVFEASKDKELLWTGPTDRLTAAEDGLLILAEDSRISAFSPR